MRIESSKLLESFKRILSLLFIVMLLLKELIYLYEDLLEENRLKPYWDTLKVLAALFQEYNNHERIFFSMDHFAKQHRVLTGKNTGKGILVKKLAYLALLGVIERDHPNNVYGLTAENAIMLKEEKQQKSFITIYRRIEYRISEVFNKLEEAKSKGITIRNLTYEVLQAQYSTAVASKCFPGRYYHNQSKRTKKALKLLEEHIQGRKIISVRELRRYLFTQRYTKGEVDKLVKAFAPEGYELVRYTKSLTELGGYKTNERVFILEP